MSSEQPSANPQGLTRQVDELAGLADALCKALRRARLVRLVLLLALVILVVAVVLVFTRLGMQLTSEDNLNAITAVAQERLAQNGDQYMTQVEKLAQDCEPALHKAFDKQVEQDTPRYLKALDKERPILIAHLHDQLAARLDKHYHDQLQRQEQILIEEQPKAKDPAVRQRLMDNLEKTIDGLQRKYYVDRFQATADGLNAAWEHFPQAQAPRRGDPPTSQQLIIELWKLLALKLPAGR